MGVQTTVRLSGSYDGDRLRAALAAAVSGDADVLVDLDGAELLDDSAAAVLRRARAAARAEGIRFTFNATRAGTRRWLSRSGLDDD